MSAVRLSLNADETITIKVGRAVEHVSIFGKEHGQIFDAVKWALISKGVVFSELAITEELTRLRLAR